MTKKELEAKIIELEKKILALQLQQPTIIHNHYHYSYAPDFSSIEPYNPWTQCGTRPMSLTGDVVLGNLVTSSLTPEAMLEIIP